MLKLFLILLWSAFFLIVNLGAKKLISIMVFDKGYLQMAASAASSPWLYMLIPLYGAAALVYMFMLRIMPISSAGPLVLTLGILLTTLMGALIYGEDIFQIRHLMGLSFCVLGILLILIK
ncbi:MAG: hypothetical protein M0033_02285 [Nitrospiraceae bacterium]|nr:hypothetical protein [Nitrospiraceae bacterium]